MDRHSPTHGGYRRVTRGALLVMAGGLAGGVIVAQHPTTPPVTAAVTPSVPIPESDRLREQAIAKVDTAIVRVNNVGKGLGSGVTTSANGYVVTNYHVVSGATSLTVTLADGRTLGAKLIGTDPVDDIAVIKITASRLPTASFGSSSSLRLGQTVLAIGNPLGIGTTVTDGIVSALNRTVNEGQNGPQSNGSILNAVQTSAAINPGNSGGALINLAGQVVGIPTLTAVDPEFNAPASGVGFAIPSNTVQNLAASDHQERARGPQRALVSGHWFPAGHAAGGTAEQPAGQPGGSDHAGRPRRTRGQGRPARGRHHRARRQHDDRHLRRPVAIAGQDQAAPDRYDTGGDAAKPAALGQSDPGRVPHPQPAVTAGGTA